MLPVLSADFWLQQQDNTDCPLLSSEAITAFNAHVYNVLNFPQVPALPDHLEAEEVRRQIAQYTLPTNTLYDGAGQALSVGYWDRLRANADPLMPDMVPVRFGLVTRRTEVRAFPTADIVTRLPYDFAFDRLLETTVDIGWPVAVVATSRDQGWFFCLTPLYWGWVRGETIAFAPRETVADFVNAEPFVVCLDSRGLVGLAAGGGVTPQMGSRLPLHTETENAYMVHVPVRTAQGQLEITDGYIPRDAGQFQAGYLPCTLNTLLTQAFKLLGEPYAWGGSRLGIFGRDCSQFVKDIYAVTGVIWPRNANQQEQVGYPQAIFTPDMDEYARKTCLVDQVSPGALLILPGHVMLYLGHVDGEPFVIHDTSSNGYHSIIVSDLSLGADSPKGSLRRRLTSAVGL
jgi:hypothetical protein